MSLRHRLGSLWIPAARAARAVRRLPRPAALVLMYHEVLPDHIDLPSWLVVRETAFVSQMTWLRQHFEVVDLDAALVWLCSGQGSRQGQRPLAVVTFDDGYAGNLDCVLPIMRRLNLPFTVYVATTVLKFDGRFWHDDVACALLARERGSLSIETSSGELRYSPGYGGPAWRWARINQVLEAIKQLPAQERRLIADRLGGRSIVPELRMLKRSNLISLFRDPLVTIGNHTRGHELLDQLTLEEARKTIIEAQRDLSDCTGTEPRHFCYPNGNYHSDTVQLVRELGFTTATTTVSEFWTDPAARLMIPRLSVGRFDSLGRFRARALGLAGPRER